MVSLRNVKSDEQARVSGSLWWQTVPCRAAATVKAVAVTIRRITMIIITTIESDL